MSNEFIEKEHQTLEYWEENQCFKELLKKNENGKPFRFLDGPITANNPMGVHHAWGRSIKDIILRYKGMNGYTCHYRNGFDTQGLWVEVEVEKELGFQDKKDIENYGMDKFTRKCIDRITRFSKTIIEQSKRLGQWMDWDNSYYTHTDENITSIWYFLKKCDENGWITKAYRPMPWCPRCGTSLSEHEMAGSHKDITHTAVFGKLPVKGMDFDILVWTTTPWTLSANVALAVNPELDYVLINVASSKKPLVLAKTALKHINEEKQVLKIFKGEELIGLEYETFFPALSVQNFDHKIVPWSEVKADEGSGVVHIAPGCGAEDYDLGKIHDLQEICPIDENGRFTDEYDFLSGELASSVAPLVFDRLAEGNKFYKTHKYTHSYPVCWRCKTEVLFRLVREWYIKTDEIRPQMLKAASTVKWEPAYIGKRMNDWLENMGDWNISRKRFYGLPLPFYPCENCGHLTVIGSKIELRERGGVAVDYLQELHRPWIDEIEITCPQCGDLVKRVTEVGDVWLDAGITPFSTLGYFSDNEQWNKYFPAEWVTEMNEQVRLWFYSLLFMSVTLTGKAPYERVLAHNSVVAEDGTKFHKTGFMIKIDDAAEKVGADTIRYLFAAANTASDVRFGYNLGDEVRRKLLGFWNIVSFFNTYAVLDKPEIQTSSLFANFTDRWLVSRINLFIKQSTENYEKYDTPDVVKEFEQCIDDVSNWYIRVNRKRFWKENMDSDKLAAFNVLFFAIKKITQVMAPIIPFMTEDIWQETIRAFEKGVEKSVHLSDFPPYGEIDKTLLDQTEKARKIIALGLKLRNEAQLKVKLPLSMLYVSGGNCQEILYDLGGIIKEELNVKGIRVLPSFDVLNNQYLSLDLKIAGRVLKGNLQTVKEYVLALSDDEMESAVQLYLANENIVIRNLSLEPDLFTLQTKSKPNIVMVKENICVALDTTMTAELQAEGTFRELLRQCQVLRKEAGFEITDRVNFEFVFDNNELSGVIKKYKSTLERETLSSVSVVEHPIMEKTIKLVSYPVTIKIQKQM